MVQKYLALRSSGEAQVSRSSSRVSLRSHSSSQLQCSGFPPKLSTSDDSGEPRDLAYTGILRNRGSGGIFFSLLDVMSSLRTEWVERVGGGAYERNPQIDVGEGGVFSGSKTNKPTHEQNEVHMHMIQHMKDLLKASQH